MSVAMPVCMRICLCSKQHMQVSTQPSDKGLLQHTLHLPYFAGWPSPPHSVLCMLLVPETLLYADLTFSISPGAACLCLFACSAAAELAEDRCDGESCES